MYKSPGVTARTQEVAETFIARQSVTDAAQELDIQPVTVFGHLWRYALAGNQLPLAPIRAYVQVSPEVENEVHTYLAGRELVSLKPLFDHFEGNLSYETLHALQLCDYLKRRPPCPTT